MTSPRACRVSSNAWWVATRRPRAGPASCSSRAPVQTLVVQCRGRGHLGDPAGDRRVGHLAAGAGAARHQQHVQRRMVVQRVVRQDPHALGAAHRPGPLGDEHAGVGVRRAACAEAVNTSHGPAKSSSSAPSKISSPYVVTVYSPRRPEPVPVVRWRDAGGRWNARRRVSAVPKPQRRATAPTGSSLSASARCAASTRTRSTYAAGGMPSSAVNRRCRWRGLSRACPARSPMLCRAPGLGVHRRDHGPRIGSVAAAPTTAAR